MIIESHMTGDMQWSEKDRTADVPQQNQKEDDYALMEVEAEPTSETPAQKPLWQRYLWLHICTAIAFCILLSLGFWQMQRLEWKNSLIERAEIRAKAAPQSVPGPEMWATLDMDEVDYLPVSIRGQFLMGELYYFDTLQKPKGSFGGQGYFVYAPFVTQYGNIILVNRGFVPASKRELSSRMSSLPERGEVLLAGLIRRPESQTFYSPEGNTQTGEWYVREPDKMAAALGLDANITAPFTIDAYENFSQAGGLPQAGETRMTFSNNHLSYAMTWFGLALTLVGVYIAFFLRILGKERADKNAALKQEEAQREKEEAEERLRKKALEDAKTRRGARARR